MKPMIDVRGLVRRFGAFEAVRGVSFEVGEGEVFGFLGPNGAGKTTTINMLVTMLRPSAGEAFIDGHSVARERAAVRRSIGIVFQDSTVDEALTAEENLRIHADVYNVPLKAYRERADSVLKMVELADRRHVRLRNYSGGMKRRLEIARGLLHYPRVLFLDEPTIGLDPQSRAHLWEYIRQVQKQEGITVFLTTHYMNEAEYCDRIAIIDNGEIVALDTPQRLKERVGGDVITLRTSDNALAAEELARYLGVGVRAEDGFLRFEAKDGARALAVAFQNLSPSIESVDLHKPSLDDVFLSLTGRSIRDEDASARDQMRDDMRRGMMTPGMRIR